MNETYASTSPGERYQSDLQRGLIIADAAQRKAVLALDQRYRYLLEKWQQPESLIRKLQTLSVLRKKAVTMRGLYFWGGVGRGKTYLMDGFFHALPGERKLRMHFHRFMLMVHKSLHQASGRSDPLMHVASNLARQVDVICFDEFFVSDIGDAMILANLLAALFDEGVLLVATSNIEPDRLYERGLQRQKFLPAIDLLKQHTEVMNVDGGIDYRLQSLDKAPVFHTPLDQNSQNAMLTLFDELTRGLHAESDKNLEIEGRTLKALRWAEGIVWFDFAMLCRGARGAADYIELARQYHTVFVSGVPVFTPSQDDEARRFVTLVDEFYDHGVKLVVSAATGLDRMYQSEDLSFAFQRTVSRMLEMQTREYLAGVHHPD